MKYLAVRFVVIAILAQDLFLVMAVALNPVWFIASFVSGAIGMYVVIREAWL